MVSLSNHEGGRTDGATTSFFDKLRMRSTGQVLKPRPMVPMSLDMTQRPFTLLNRFLQFRTELGQLWRAFRAPETPMHLKALMLLVPLYLLSPLDLIPDLIPLDRDRVLLPVLSRMPVIGDRPKGGRLGRRRRRGLFPPLQHALSPFLVGAALAAVGDDKYAKRRSGIKRRAENLQGALCFRKEGDRCRSMTHCNCRYRFRRKA